METSIWAGKTVKIQSTDPKYDGQIMVVEDYWINVYGKSWMFSDGNPAALQYAIHSGFMGLPYDDNVIYGKVNGLGVLVHESEIRGGV